MRSGRRPTWVYGAGREPDPRFSLANERTFLSWIRTSLSLLAAGVALESLEVPIEAGLRSAASVTLILLALSCPIEALVGWMRSERALRTELPLPMPTTAFLLAPGVLLVGALLLVGLVLGS